MKTEKDTTLKNNLENDDNFVGENASTVVEEYYWPDAESGFIVLPAFSAFFRYSIPWRAHFLTNKCIPRSSFYDAVFITS